MPRFKRHCEDNPGGWSDEVAPVMSRYRAACCDCDLVHDVQFRIVKVTERFEDGSWTYEDIDDPDYRVMLRARRNNRSTAAMRRNKEEK